MTIFAGASAHPLVSKWINWLEDKSWTWACEFTSLAARGQWLAVNDPFIAALVSAHLQGTLGPLGPRLNSQYDPNPDQATTSEAARLMRRAINAISAATWKGHTLDAEGVRSRYDLELALAWGAFVLGEMFAVRVAKRGKSRWRLISPERVGNPSGLTNSATLRDGFALSDGEAVGMWVRLSASAQITDKHAWEYIAFTADDGTPNVIWRKGLQLPGMMRCVSRLAPIIIMQRQLGGVLESHVAAKRLQAIYGMIVKAQDEEEWKAAQESGSALVPGALDVQGPLNVWVAPPDGDVSFTDTKFNGADLKDYLTICYKVECATVQIPVDVVLCQMGEASLSSARAGLDQFERTCLTEHTRHTSEATEIIDRVEIADTILAGRLSLPMAELAISTNGTYSQPPKYSTDLEKDANTVAQMIKVGISKKTAFRRIFGIDYEDETEANIEAEAFTLAQSESSKAQHDEHFLARVKRIQDLIASLGVSGVTWPAVIAASGADSAPGAYIAATGASVQAESTAATQTSSDTGKPPTTNQTHGAASPVPGGQTASLFQRFAAFLGLKDAA